MSDGEDGTRGDAVLEARGLGCIRGERPVFSGVAFRLEAGGALVLVGPNGAGKSSLLRILAGFLKPTAGAVLWGGAPIDDSWEESRARTHYVGHLEAVKPALTAAENLRAWVGFRGERAAAPDALDRLGIAELASVPARFLSAGQKRRLALARLVASPATLWLLDEPTVTLDAASAERVAGLIAAHRASGGMVVVATHAEIALDAAERLDMARHAASSGMLVEAAGEPDGIEPEHDVW